MCLAYKKRVSTHNGRSSTGRKVQILKLSVKLLFRLTFHWLPSLCIVQGNIVCSTVMWIWPCCTLQTDEGEKMPVNRMKLWNRYTIRLTQPVFGNNWHWSLRYPYSESDYQKRKSSSESLFAVMLWEAYGYDRSHQIILTLWPVPMLPWRRQFWVIAGLTPNCRRGQLFFVLSRSVQGCMHTFFVARVQVCSLHQGNPYFSRSCRWIVRSSMGRSSLPFVLSNMAFTMLLALASSWAKTEK